MSDPNDFVTTVPASPPPSPNVDQTPSPHAIEADARETWVTNNEMSDNIAANDFEKQVHGRMDSKSIEFRQMTNYKMTAEQKKVIDGKKDDALGQFSASGQVTWNTNKKNKKSKNNVKATPLSPSDRKKAANGLPNNIECGMFMHVQEVRNDSAKIGLFSSILESVTEDFCHLNHDVPPNDALSDVMLQAGDHFWMEIAETPDSLPSKLWQLERAYLHFKTEKRPLAKVAVICLNGVKDVYDEAVKLAVNHFKTDKLTLWTILKEIPVYVLYTPNRNIYRSLYKIETQMATKSDLEELRKTMATKSDLEELRKTMATNLDKVVAAVESLSKRPYSGSDSVGNSHGGGEV
jgi:hypothetical protein